MSQHDKKLDQAKEVFLKSLEIGRKLKLTRHTCIVLKSLGEVYALQGNIPDAEEALEESYTLATGEKDKLIMANAQGTRGKLLLEHNQFERASTYLQESFALYEELQNSQGVRLLYFLGKTLVILNKREEVQSYCQRALACWPGDHRIEATQRYLQRYLPKISTHIQPSARKVGRITLLIPAGPQRAPYGFIEPDDGSQVIYFKQKVVTGELKRHLRNGMRVWADTQVVQGRIRAIRVGKDGGDTQ